MINIHTYRFLLFRRLTTVGIVGILLLLFVTSCRPPKTFAESHRDTDISTFISLSIDRIDSLAMNDPASLKREIQDICEMMYARGCNLAAEKIACYPYGIDPEERPDIAKRLLTSTLLPGKLAPEIVGATPVKKGKDNKYTIVFFYESRCRSCQTMIDGLIKDYEGFQRNGIRVITISADKDKTLFEDYSSKFPWNNKLCDFQYYDSPNFINYGVANVPTMFLIDGNGKVTGQYYSPDEIYGVIFN